MTVRPTIQKQGREALLHFGHLHRMGGTSIRRITLHSLRVPLKAPFITSLGALEHADNVAVLIHAADGTIGSGECSPFWAINGETAGTCIEVGSHLARALIGHDVFDIAGAHARMDRLIFGNNSIKSAFDIALHDLASRTAGVPLWQFTGGRRRDDLVTDYTVSIGAPEKMAGDAREIVRNGFQVIKVKLGGNGDEDIERIRTIREAIGARIPLRIDANQGWDPDSAIRVLNALAPLGIQHCEEPIPRWRFMDLRRVKEASPIPIMADESCCDHHDAERLIALGACQRFNIKLGKSGGLFKARKIIALAGRAGIQIQIGGFMESRLAWTAAAHLACTSQAIRYFDMDTPLMFTRDPVNGGMRYGNGGKITLPEGPGLGATFDPAELGSPVVDLPL